MLRIIQVAFSLFCLASCVIIEDNYAKRELIVQRALTSVNSAQMFMTVVPSPLEISYRIFQSMSINDIQSFQIVPNTMDLDSSLFGYQCQSPICKATCLGEGLRESLSSNFTTNGTLFSLDQMYQALEGIRSQDSFQFNTPIPVERFTLTNVTFMDAFYVHSKEPFTPNLVGGNCTVGNGTFGFGRGLEGAMGPTIMSRFIEASNSDALAIYYSLRGLYGLLWVSNDISYDAPSPNFYANYINEWSLWTLPITNLQFDTISLGANGIGVIDAASTYLRMPIVYANFIAQQLSATAQSTPDGIRYTIPNCTPATLPSILINIAGDSYTISGYGYAYETTGTNCLALFVGSDPMYDDTPIWRLGVPFLQSSLTVLNYTSNTIALTPLAIV